MFTFLSPSLIYVYSGSMKERKTFWINTVYLFRLVVGNNDRFKYFDHFSAHSISIKYFPSSPYRIAFTNLVQVRRTFYVNQI